MHLVMQRLDVISFQNNKASFIEKKHLPAPHRSSSCERFAPYISC
jgi:hypothetical protein